MNTCDLCDKESHVLSTAGLCPLCEQLVMMWLKDPGQVAFDGYHAHLQHKTGIARPDFNDISEAEAESWRGCVGLVVQVLAWTEVRKIQGELEGIRWPQPN